MIIDELFEGPQLCPECGGISFSDLILAEKKDACYYKVKASAKVWPSAYASGRLVQCRKKGAANYGKSKTESVAETGPFSYGKPPRKGSVADLAAKKRKEQERGQQPIEPKDQQVGVAKVKKGVAEGSNQSGLEQLIQQYEDMVENVYGMVPGPRQRKEIAARDALEARIEALPGGKSALEKWARAYNDSFDEGVAEEQELDEKWSQKYKSSINCANPRGFSQKAHCAGRNKNEDVEESLGKQIHSTFQTMGDSFSDAHLAKGISYFLQDRHQEGENWLRGKIPLAAQAAVFGKLKTLQAQGGVDVNKNPNVQQYIDDKLVPWVKNQIQQHVKEGVMYGAENLNVGDDVIISGDVNLKGATGVIDSFGQDKRFVVVNLYNHGKHSFHSSDVSANDYDNDEHDDDMAEGEQQKGADYRDPKEVDYDDEYDAMVARVKKLAGLGPLKTVYDPAKRVYRNIPTAVQPKK